MTSIETSAPATVGRTAYAYVMAKDWGNLPDSWVLDDVAAVGVDSQDRVYVFNRGNHPMIVFDREGRFLRSWGEGLFKRPHGLHVAPDDTLYCTDDGDHTVRQCTNEGKVLLEIGIPNKPAPYMSGRPFHRCTHTALSPTGDIFVSDGYGNARVHKYAPNGKHLMSWGDPGTGPGEFNIVHNITCDDEGWVYVADRENHRIQVFNGAGRYETQWNNLHRPCGLCMTRGKRPVCYVGELGPGLAVNKNVPNIGPRLSVLAHDGTLIGRVDNAQLGGSDPFRSPHGVAIDSRGDLYVGEVSYTSWRRDFPDQPPPPGLRSLRKLIRQSE